MAKFEMFHVVFKISDVWDRLKVEECLIWLLLKT